MLRIRQTSPEIEISGLVFCFPASSDKVHKKEKALGLPFLLCANALRIRRA